MRCQSDVPSKSNHDKLIAMNEQEKNAPSPGIPAAHFADAPDEIQLRLQDGCAELGIDLTVDQVSQFEQYYRELVAWNRRFNLTAITDYEDVQVKHFLDCVAGWPLIAEELGQGITPSHPLRLRLRLLLPPR